MLKKFFVLAVDDEQRILNFLQLKLKASGYDVITAGSGPEAITQVKVRQSGPDAFTSQKALLASKVERSI